MTPSNDRPVSRRRLLSALGATAGFATVGVGEVRATRSGRDAESCTETTVGPSMVHYNDSIHEVCSDDAPETVAIREAVKTSLADEYPTVGALIDAGYIPYFDFFADGSWSHWINPEFIGDDSMVDPSRPESVLVDHTWWRPIGVMFMATVEGERRDPPPTVYEDDGACVPWHAHVGLPGRYAWWKYQTVYGDVSEFPCRTPWMMHVWNYPHSESTYAHAAPEYRGGPPAEDPGFETDADPNEEELAPKHLPAALSAKVEDLWQSPR
ncbi:hypothetical protein SAMN04487948_103255 [Halogranum amylolyticum]|uniref:Uncharacterized protein n=1 Tax=Halogranum amylolyticum TaxID=660520 RepID=A0A1H8QRJ4_9EURY|nr:hypothetical protein [Halogranum amylolyticum]SEO56483.1 hypothetical protein SAMN04487948_103255 [Halogranum amylolyticum]